MHRESNLGMDFQKYRNVRIERPLMNDIQEVRLRHQVMNEDYSEEVNQLEEAAC